MKEAFSTKPSTPERKEYQVILEYLLQEETPEMMNGALKILKAIEKDFPEKLPDIVILPDTSARPLFYLFNESFKQIANKRGCNAPKFFFFSSFRNDLSVRQRVAEKELGRTFENIILELNETIEAAEKGELDDPVSEEDHAHAVSFRDKLNADFETLKSIKENLTSQAEYIKKSLPENGKMIIIEDYISDIAVNISQIRQAFGDNIRAYGFMSNKEPSQFEEDENVFIVSKDPEAEGEKLGYGFTWRKKRAIGVTKNQDGTAVTRNTLKSEDVAKLRNDLSRLGKVIAEIYLEYKYGKD